MKSSSLSAQAPARGVAPEALMRAVLLAPGVALPPLLIGLRAAAALDSALLGMAAAFMTFLFGVALLGAMAPRAGRRR